MKLNLLLVRRLSVIKQAMERRMLGISLRDRIRNEDIRRRTNIIDIAPKIANLSFLHQVKRESGQGRRKPLVAGSTRPMSNSGR